MRNSPIFFLLSHGVGNTTCGPYRRGDRRFADLGLRSEVMKMFPSFSLLMLFSIHLLDL